ncbi:hypothetical protein GGR52DRAFT_562604 [Hypoxylon sp. FL1284]|nr:hypothetical protein GGR52DRAFT_562604 [Hypoxylon sp. FL1284]
MATITISPELPPNDVILLRNLADDVERYQEQNAVPHGSGSSKSGGAAKSSDGIAKRASSAPSQDDEDVAANGIGSREYISTQRDDDDLSRMRALNDPASQDYEPTVFVSVDLRDLEARLHPLIYKHVLLPYIKWAQGIARHPSDVVMVTHLILYFTTSVPSALWLFHRFTWAHGLLHAAMQFYYMGTYTLMMHQHIHGGGVLRRKARAVRLLDALFPYVTDPLMGHTWNTYYYHHVKHHHVEGNGPDDLSSTIRFQRDSAWHFAQYVARFYFFVWLDLPLYFLRKGRRALALKVFLSEVVSYSGLAALFRFGAGRPAACVFLAPLMLMRLGLMVGNWGQHALVDPDEPDSDYRSSITLIDVPSNRYCFNDGYHTSHHLHPRRHWREHPAHLLARKAAYGAEGALVLHGIDYLELTARLLLHHYDYLAARVVPVGKRQLDMSLEQRADWLRACTRRFDEREIGEKFRKPAAAASAGGEKDE